MSLLQWCGWVLVMDCCSYVIPLWKIQPICIISFSKDFTKLPEPDSLCNNSRCRLYKVVRIVYYRTANEVNIAPHLPPLTHGSPTWRSIGEELPVQLNPQQSHVLVDGRLHWLSLRGRYQVARNIVSFDLADEPFREVPQPAGCYNFCWRQSHLVSFSEYERICPLR